jgi:RimJ/RimL family protein N-acetyltransferase/pimeloyl-ACP methyl ester carboxylesterase
MKTFVLVGGAWLGGWCWQGVARRLRARGHDVHPVTLTGLGDRVHLARPEVDLETHITDVVNLLDYEEFSGVWLVGHSYGGTVVTGVADRRPERLARLVYLDTGPLDNGQAIVDTYPPDYRARVEHEVAERGDGWRWALPSFDELGQTSSLSGLDEAQLERFRAKATPQPFRTFAQPLRLDRPLGGPYGRVGIICTESGLTVAALRELIASGDPRFQAFATPDWSLHELHTGHWPMLSAPDDLAELLHELTGAQGSLEPEGEGGRPMERTDSAPVSISVDLPTLLRGRNVVLRPLRGEDVERVAQIQAEPGVARWWGPPDEAELRRQAEGRDEAKAFAIERESELVGLIQYHEENEPDFRHAGIDLFLAERAQGSGLGPDAVRALARYLFDERGHHRLTIDPAADNAAAIRAYEKVGFRTVGVLREYWRSPEGAWRDGLLMDLLAREFDPV